MEAPRSHRQKVIRRRAVLLMSAAVAGLLLLTGSYLWLLGGTTPNGIPAIGGPFTLVSDADDVVTDRDFRGRFLLVYFGYTSCPDICPTTLSAVADALDILGNKAGKLTPIFITVDPKRDTPAVLHAYVRSFSPRILGLTGNATQLQSVEREYHISSIVRQNGSQVSNYVVDHTAVLFLVAPDGHYLAPFPATETGAGIAERLSPYIK